MTNRYIQMASDQTSLELGEMVVDIKTDGIQIGNMSDTKGSDLKPIFKNFRFNYSRIIGWDKIMLIIIFIIVLVILTLLIIFMSISYHFNLQIQKNSEMSDQPCLTFACLEAAVDINKSINTSVDPCINFHQFVCSKWEDAQVFPRGTSRYGTFDVVNTELFKIQKRLLETQNILDQTSSWAKAIRLYNSCNDIDTINRLGSAPLKNHLEKIYNKYGGWDMLMEDATFPIHSWRFEKVVEDPNVLSPIFKIVVYDDEKNSGKNGIYLYLASLMLEKQYIQNSTKPENKKIIDAYLEYMYNIGKLLGVRPSKFGYFNEVMELEAKIARFHPNEEDQRDPDSLYNKMSLSRLQTEFCPLLNWTEILRRRFELVNLTLSNDIEIIVKSPENLKQICALFATYSIDSAKKLILHNYIVWSFVSEMTAYLSKDFLDVIDNFNKVYKGSSGSRERWETCVGVMQDCMGLVLGNMYISQQFDKRSKPQVLEMINFMKDQFRDNLRSNKWMGEATINEAIKKIDTMLPIIGYTESSLNKKYIEEYYHQIEINNNTYYDNIHRLGYKFTLRDYAKIFKPSENTSIETPQEVNAFYSPNKNEIIFPAGILQKPFFDPGFPRSLKYGAIGSAIGHEITHGFDDTGSKYDSRGNLRSWWTNATRELFKEKSDCFVKQYSQYSLYGQSINGLNTLGENIADNGGLRLTYQVFKYLEKRLGVEKLLPGLKYTHDQLFFISFARIWCNLATRQSTIINIFSNSHTPNMYRIIGVLSNLNEFAEAFNCPVGSQMNPRKKCIVW